MNDKQKKLPKNYHYFEVQILHVDEPVTFDGSDIKYYKTVCMVLGELEVIYFAEKYEVGQHKIALKLEPFVSERGKRFLKLKGPMTKEKQKELGII